ncbi:MAG TPA: DinB family protein [Terriglobia bacterium]|nr:DinB family protein [Terriglobia bacterium]
MVSIDTLQELYDYNYWARDRQLQACAKLSNEQFQRPMGSSFNSLRDTLAHLLVVEWVWLERFQGRSPRAIPGWLDALQTVGSVRERWHDIERDMRRYLAELQPEALPHPLSYVNLKGEAWTYPLGQALFHLVNHQTYHRGQVTTLLRQLGAESVAIDYLVYRDERNQLHAEAGT